MKKFIIVVAVLCALTSSVWGQAASFTSASTEHYVVWSAGDQAQATQLGAKLEGLFELYNEYFRFDEIALKAPLTVRAFADKESFNAYLQKVIGQPKDDFVYLHYPTIERSELVLFVKADKAEFDASLAHQSFVQYLKAFVVDPPLWIREGFAVYFERAAWDDAASAVKYNENQAWLETVKLLKSENKLYKIDGLMGLSAEEAKLGLDVFYPQSWALVSFFLNSTNARYNRFVWDSIALMRASAAQADNQLAVQNFFKKWYGDSVIDQDFNAYIDSQLTFAEFVTTGVQAYGDKAFDKAQELFLSALNKNSSNYISHYYLGLIAYARNDFAAAEKYYKSALSLGSDLAITNYALGINAFASRRFEEAKVYLDLAATTDPTRYQEKAGEIITRINADMTPAAGGK